MAAIEKNIYQGGANAVLNAERRNFYVSPNVIKTQYAQLTPFLTSVANWRTVNPPDPQFKMFQYTFKRKQYFKTGGTASIGADDTDQTLVVSPTGAVGMPAALTNQIVGYKCAVIADDGTGSAPSMNPADVKGQVIITVFNSATSVDVINAGAGAFSIASGDWLWVLGTAFGEGSEAANPGHDEVSVAWNQCGIHKTSFQLTRTIQKAMLRGDMNEFNRLKEIAKRDHKRQNEMSLLFSTSNIGTNLAADDAFGDGGRTDANGNTIRQTYGIFKAIYDKGSATGDNQNIFAIQENNFDYNQLVDWSQKIFDQSETKTLPVYCGDYLMAFINKIQGTPGVKLKSDSKLGVKMPELGSTRTSTLGFNIREWETPFGVMQFAPTISFTDSPYAKCGMAIDPEDVFFAEYDAPMYMENIKTDNAPDYRKDQFMSDNGVGITNLYKHNVFYLV